MAQSDELVIARPAVALLGPVPEPDAVSARLVPAAASPGQQPRAVRRAVGPASGEPVAAGERTIDAGGIVASHGSSGLSDRGFVRSGGALVDRVTLDGVAVTEHDQPWPAHLNPMLARSFPIPYSTGPACGLSLPGVARRVPGRPAYG